MTKQHVNYVLRFKILDFIQLLTEKSFGKLINLKMYESQVLCQQRSDSGDHLSEKNSK